jgi:hypothetical protein
MNLLPSLEIKESLAQAIGVMSGWWEVQWPRILTMPSPSKRRRERGMKSEFWSMGERIFSINWYFRNWHHRQQQRKRYKATLTNVESDSWEKSIQSKILCLDLNDIPSRSHKENTDNTFWMDFQIELNGFRIWDMVDSSNLTQKWWY